MGIDRKTETQTFTVLFILVGKDQPFAGNEFFTRCKLFSLGDYQKRTAFTGHGLTDGNKKCTQFKYLKLGSTAKAAKRAKKREDSFFARFAAFAVDPVAYCYPKIRENEPCPFTEAEIIC